MTKLTAGLLHGLILSMIIILAHAVLSCASALELSDMRARDKQAHYFAGMAGGYIGYDLLTDHTNLSPTQKWLITTGSICLISIAYEHAVGVRDSNDALATTIGAVSGATMCFAFKWEF